MVRGCSRSKGFCLGRLPICGGFSKHRRGPWWFVDPRLDRASIIHGLECSENFHQMIRKVWRILEDSGRVIIIAINRRGLWSRIDNSPFWNRLPYTPRQPDQSLRDLLFNTFQKDPSPFYPAEKFTCGFGVLVTLGKYWPSYFLHFFWCINHRSGKAALCWNPFFGWQASQKIL